MSPADTLSRINRSLDRIERVAESRADEAEREIEAEREREAEARRDQARRHADACRRHGEKYSDAFDAHGVRMPPPIDNEFPGDYRRRLLQRLMDKLPEDHELSGITAADLSRDAIKIVEPRAIEAAKAEGERPSEENLPADGSLIARHRTDDLGQRRIEWHGRESFIKALSLPGKRVVAIHTPRGSHLFAGALREGMSVEGRSLNSGLWQ